jgi:hypothetical protein
LATDSSVQHGRNTVLRDLFFVEISKVSTDNIRAVLLEIIAGLPQGTGYNLQSSAVLGSAKDRFNTRGNNELEAAILTEFYELFRTGYLAWGHNLSNPDPPFFHLTERGRKTLAHLSGDPGNPEGYLRRIDGIGPVNAVARSYLDEALRCYVADLYKAGAVMVGASAESLIIELRDDVSTRLSAKGSAPSSDLKDWRVSKILAGLKRVLDAQPL